jgi:hypothetical protein
VLFFIFILVCSLFVVSGCLSALQKQFRAYIDDDSRWKLVEGCSSEQCYPKVDYLKSADMTIKIEFDRHYKGDFFIIRTWFTEAARVCSYTPSGVTVQLKDGHTLFPKVLKCSNTIWDIHNLRSYSSIEEPVFINKRECFLLFFDHPIPLLYDVFTMNMKQALTVNGEQIDVPLIRFNHNPKFK